ncbi:putative sulfate exporter family transporter [Alsobacter sp. SYSU M60028]|uniref:Sulfate exporter family transporter n=1 Tax=Alsobacter ponti TaxID=2962936 RepID=A0ABT1L8I4_9HYPH|nr:putative sulfate exporter family transporter [Alsobacter ponti]MCP8937704.1 putative sulfate exporter family transporter [Alsobacter ponti]
MAEQAQTGGVAAMRAASARNLARVLAPGVALSAAVAVASVLVEPLTGRAIGALTGRAVVVPAVVVALLIGMALHRFAARPLFEPGMAFSVKKLLRIAIALLGLRIALGDIWALGFGTALLVVAAMAVTVVSGVAFARLFGREAAYGALAGGATAVCGASAALATASVLPKYPNRDADTVFTVVAVNALSTLAMVAYPALGPVFGFDDRTLGILLGATIHDVAQVVGAGYSVSETTGDAAVIVKLFRVFLLLPVVLGVGWWFAGRGGAQNARVPVPVFALVFLALVLVNSAGLAPAAVKAVVSEASRWGLLIAIGALGLGTSITAILRVGWRHVAVVCGTTAVILGAVLAGLLVLR